MTPLAKKIIIGVIALVLVVLIAIGFLIAAGVTGWKAAMRSGNEASAIQSLKAIAVGEVQYYNAHSRTFGTFNQLVKDGFDPRFSREVPSVDGYVFTLKVVPKSTTQPSSYTLNADPQDESTGRSHFYIDSTDSFIRVNRNHPAGLKDPPLEP